MTVATREETRKEMTTGQPHEVSGAESTRPGRVVTPVVDIFENERAITVLADMPGVRTDGLSIDLRESVLTIDGRVTPPAAEGEQVLAVEYEPASFYRQFRLSKAIDQGGIDAKLHNGVLQLTLPKAEEAQPRKIEVRAD